MFRFGQEKLRHELESQINVSSCNTTRYPSSPSYFSREKREKKMGRRFDGILYPFLPFSSIHAIFETDSCLKIGFNFISSPFSFKILLLFSIVEQK